MVVKRFTLLQSKTESPVFIFCPSSIIGLNELFRTSPLYTIYPNPANATFSAVINCDKAGTASMSITDMMGKTIVNRNITVQKGAQTLTQDISQMAAGIYFVNFLQDGKMQTSKLVVIKS